MIIMISERYEDRYNGKLISLFGAHTERIQISSSSTTTLTGEPVRLLFLKFV